MGKGFKRKESVASEDLQHSLFVDTQICTERCTEMFLKILGDFSKKHGDFSENV